MKGFFYINDIDLSIELLKKSTETVSKRKKDKSGKMKKITYYNIPISFDIETSSFYEKGEKRAIMYIWQMDINGICVYGRTWLEFIDTLDLLSDIYQTDINNRIVIYVHNLSYEFQFIRKHLDIESVFALKSRKVANVLTKNGIEFRCSYILSGKSLAKIAADLKEHKAKKLIGDLDYSLIRHSETHITEKELEYCYWDVKILEFYILEKIKEDGDISKIKMTKTGYVRTYVRNACFGNDLPDRKERGKQSARYHKLMKHLSIQSLDEYQQDMRAFMGGYVHSSPQTATFIWNDVNSIDFNSSYPRVICSCYFPVTKAENVDIKTFDDFKININNYCCIFDVIFYDLESTFLADNYISYSKCWDVEKNICANGRLVSANKCSMTITELDFFTIRKTYKWKKMEVKNLRRYQRGFLPRPIILSTLTFYEMKTKLKGVQFREDDYLLGKEMLNSIYGMMVTSIEGSNEIYQNNEWVKNPQTEQEALDEYNNSWSRFLFIPWGIYVTAWARYWLWTGVQEFGNGTIKGTSDYLYSDTDSIKCINYKNHEHYVKQYNDTLRNDLYRVCEWYDIDKQKVEPETIKGQKKLLGAWDDDGHYFAFKTLGAKRYLSYEIKKGFSMTVSGVNKTTAMPYLMKKANDERTTPFHLFDDEMYIPPEYAGKKCLTYIDEMTDGYVTDYTGKKCYYNELSSVHMESSDYSLGMSAEFINYIKMISEVDELC